MRYSPIIFLLLVCCTTRDIVQDVSSSGAEGTGESLETGIHPDPDFFADGCEALLSCECPRHRYDSVETCQLLGAAGMVGAETEAVLLGLHLDKECYRDLVYFDNDLRFGCMSHQEYQRTHPNDLWYPDLDSCGACSPGYGERQLGETCSYYHNALSDCAPGLRCQGSICRDPCIVVGVPCVDWFDSVCQSGYDKDSNWDHRFICDDSTKRCTGVVGPAAGESCLSGKCGAYTQCEDDICIPTPPAVCGG